jgi:hypothetical protein
LRAFLLPVLTHIGKEQPFHQHWIASSPWRATK